MKPELFLLLALGASSTSACGVYAFCHCTNSDGSYDNSATKTVCGWYGRQLVYATKNNGPSTQDQECFEIGTPFSNCKWREHCIDAGAKGADSNCWCGGNCRYNPPAEPPV
jgi:hypothetical protein